MLHLLLLLLLPAGPLGAPGALPLMRVWVLLAEVCPLEQQQQLSFALPWALLLLLLAAALVARLVLQMLQQ